MNTMEQLARSKALAFTTAVTSDSRWVLEDELMCQVFGFTLYGYALGVGRVVCFMDVADIQAMAAGELSGLGIGPKYAVNSESSAGIQLFVTPKAIDMSLQSLGWVPET